MLRRNIAIAVVTASAVILAGCGPASNNSQANQPAAASSAAPAQSNAQSNAQAEQARQAAARKAAERKRAAERRAEQRRAEAAARARQACSDCGTVTAVTPVKVEGKGHNLIGTLAGAALGGFLGSRFGRGQGKTAMTAAGAVGGALAGHAAEGEMTAKTVYKITISMENGGTREITLAQRHGLTVGAKVRVNGNDISPR